MREILFKGKRKDNNEWIYGYVAYVPQVLLHLSQWFIMEFIGIESGEPLFEYYEVMPETVCQYIGIKDKAGNRIFENSIMKGLFGTGIGCDSTKYKEFNFKVAHHGHSPEFHLEMPNNYGRYRFCPHLTDCLVIGNTFDHPELLQSL